MKCQILGQRTIDKNRIWTDLKLGPLGGDVPKSWPSPPHLTVSWSSGGWPSTVRVFLRVWEEFTGRWEDIKSPMRMTKFLCLAESLFHRGIAYISVGIWKTWEAGPQRGYCVTSYFMFPLPHVSVSFAITTNKTFTSPVGIFQHSYYCPVMQKMHIRIRILDCPARLRVIWAWTSYHCILHLSLLPSGSLKQLSLSYPLFTTVYWAWYGG